MMVPEETWLAMQRKRTRQNNDNKTEMLLILVRSEINFGCVSPPHQVCLNVVR